MAKNHIWSRVINDRNLSACEELVDHVPAIPTRSWAFHLAPINVGSPACESLSSYFLRLSEAHSVTPRRLFYNAPNHEIVWKGNGNSNRGLVGPNSSTGTSQINGNGLIAKKWVSAVESITLQRGLSVLTFLPFRDGISSKQVCRRERAWCPPCLEDQEHLDAVIYEQLLWTNKYVSVCRTHKVPLQTRCPHCAKTSHVLKGSMQPGRCPTCGAWLGQPLTDVEKPAIETESFRYDLFVANQIAGLITVSPGLKREFSKETPRKTIVALVTRRFAGNTRALTKYLGFPKGIETDLTSRKPHRFVTLRVLLKLAYLARVNLLELLTDPNALADFSPSIPLASTNHSPLMRKKEVVLPAFADALREKPPPSLAEIAGRLGYRSFRHLRRCAPEIFDVINRNYLTSERGRAARSGLHRRLQSKARIEAALTAALNENPPPTLDQVAQSLGYKHGLSIKASFPALCNALNRKHPTRLSLRAHMVESELKKSLQSPMPEDLLTVAKRLGYRSSHYLGLTHRDLCKRIRVRYEAHKKAILLADVRIQLDAVLSETPPPTLIATIRKLGVSHRWLRIHFPGVTNAIGERYLTYRREQAIAKKTLDRERIREIVRELHNQGTFPSMNAVLDVFTPRALKHSELWATIKQARENLV